MTAAPPILAMAPADLEACAREPIHLPGSIQPHGVLLALREPHGPVHRASANCADVFQRPIDTILGASLADLFGPEAPAIQRAIADATLDSTPLFITAIRLAGEHHNVLVHRWRDGLIVELERTDLPATVPFAGLYPLVRAFLARLEQTRSVRELAQLAAEEVRQLTGFDRVLVYRFDEQWNGTVIAEDGNGRLPSYLELRFPASDIPAQARELYRLNRIRIIPDADYVPVPLVGRDADAAPLDLSYSTLRSVSPVHVEYMKNMGTAASMSISIVREGQLWGLISCHHRTPRHVAFGVRTACDLLGQMLSLQMAAAERRAEYEWRIRHRALQGRLLASMATAGDFTAALRDHAELLLNLVNAEGAAVIHEDKVTLLGRAPDEAQVRALVGRLDGSAEQEVFHTDELVRLMPEARAFRDRAAGVLAIAISKLHSSWVLWFRPEVVQTLRWGGDPRKPAEPSPETGRIHPRRSFALWKQQVELKSAPWQSMEIEAATQFRSDIVGIVLRRAEELADLSAELERSNKELEAFSYSVSHDLRAPFRHILGYAELLRQTQAAAADEEARRYIDTIIESAHYAGTLVDNLLSFSQMGRSRLNYVDVDMAALAREVQRAVAGEAAGRDIRWLIGALAPARGDLMMLRLVWRNLLDNAVKYTRTRPQATIEIGGHAAESEAVYFVRDNGVGFDMSYVDKLFGVFQRLHRIEEFEGTGIGLANVRRIVARHGGRTWAQGEVGKGATFYFSLPRERSDG
jgi:light-regulated signal transduction histidine kinase (bacteriophytochrome)